MQEVNGTRSPKWCAGCHDPAVLFSGMMEQPVANFIDKPEAHAGLGCVSCHSIVAVKSTMGQGDYVHEYPALHDLATSENKFVRAIHDFVVRVNPEPHRRAFMKPFVRSQTADFCSSCHKVHLDVPVNNYRWFRGFNDYDAWQASGVSGQGARSFYYPPKSQRCVDCHMPLVPSNDLGNVNGMVHSHRFPGANTALPIANDDKEQFDVVEKFLKDNIVTVDIFSVSPASPLSTTLDAPQEMATTFAVGEEADAAIASQGAATQPATPITAPLDRVDAVVRRGDSARVDVVVRTRKVGHFFPGGTVDAFDVWVELQAVDDKGQTIFWSGKVDDEGRGPVDKTAHFYRSLQVDAHGNAINKRNAWSTRALVYTRLIPPGAADTVRYRLQIPKNAGDKIHLKAKLHYRKFAWWNTQFAYAGIRDSEGQPHTPHYDDGRWVFTGDTSRVSGKLKKIPDLPIITIAQDEKTIRVAGSGSAAPSPQAVLKPDDWTRWNDYGIGLFLQGDLKNAEAAFTKITEIDPKNPDGWVNIGRVRVQEGNLEGAKEVLERALALSPDLARANFFYARALRGEGKYEEALDRYRRVLAQYPRDRVVRNDAGRTLFLLRKYAEAIKELQYVLTIDPEDIQAHYNLMLCYNGLGQEDKAKEHETRYLRFKADESSQAITGPYRLSNPADNNERQAIHEHAGSN
jgi:tetratricopeptide (TPR) repeat protein